MNKYTLEERLEIGRQIYSHQLTVNEAAVKYGINHYTARDQIRIFLKSLSSQKYTYRPVDTLVKEKKSCESANLHSYKALAFICR